MKDKLSVKGEIELVLRDANGLVKVREVLDNTYTNNGLAWIADRLSTTPDLTAMSHVAVGTGAIGTPETATALTTETARKALTSLTDTANVLTAVGEFAAGEGTGSLREMGTLNLSASGTLIACRNFSLDKEAADTLTITWRTTLDRA